MHSLQRRTPRQLPRLPEIRRSSEKTNRAKNDSGIQNHRYQKRR